MSKLEEELREIEELIFKSKSLTAKLTKKVESHPLVEYFEEIEFSWRGVYFLHFKPLAPWLRELDIKVGSYATPGWESEFKTGIFLEPDLYSKSKEFDLYFPGDGKGSYSRDNVRIGTDTVSVREYLEFFLPEKTEKMYDELFLVPVEEKKLESIKNVDDYIDWYYGQIDKVITTLKKSLKLVKEVAIDNPMFNKGGELFDADTEVKYARGGRLTKATISYMGDQLAGEIEDFLDLTELATNVLYDNDEGVYSSAEYVNDKEDVKRMDDQYDDVNRIIGDALNKLSFQYDRGDYAKGGDVDPEYLEFKKLSKKLSSGNITPKEKERLFILAYGEDYVKSKNKGKKRKYDDSGKRVKDRDRDEYAKGGRLSIAEIKRRTQETNPYFFDKKTMKFFGQRMSDFKVTSMEDGRYKVSAPTYSNDFRTGERKRMKDTVRYFNPKNNELERE